MNIAVGVIVGVQRRNSRTARFALGFVPVDRQRTVIYCPPLPAERLQARPIRRC
jgi:hypothetical protein